jgi:hypothetical protein
MLGDNTDSLTPHDIGGESMWADKYRDSDRSGTGERYRRARQWHFVDIEFDSPNLAQACHNHPKLPPDTLASQGGLADACTSIRLTNSRPSLPTPKARRKSGSSL